MKFKTKIAYTAVLASLGVVAGSAQAAFLSEDGTGQVLLYPYYTVQNGYDTYVSVVNTTSSAKAVKVRFIEGKASQEVLDFNLYLSAYDVWAGAVTPSTSGGARLVVTDTSCTAPIISGSVDFRNAQYTGINDDPYEDDLSRTREGYIEIIEMGALTQDPTVGSNSSPKFAWAVTHDKATGKPHNCQFVSDAFANGTNAADLTNFVGSPTGGLFGSATLINGPQGTDYSYDPVVIDSFMTAANHTVPGSLQPSLNDANPVSVVIQRNVENNSQDVIKTFWTATGGALPAQVGVAQSGRHAISAVLMHKSIFNEYSVEASINAGTDWVVTFPTKRFHLQTLSSGVFGAWGTSAELPFTKAPKNALIDVAPLPWTVWRACEKISAKPYNREELTSGSIDFSPAPPSGTTLCYESNVITFKNSKVLSSALETNLANVYDSGWLNLSFNDGQKLVSDITTTTVNGVRVGTGSSVYSGLPAIGFAVEKYVNGNVGGVLSNYGGSFIHKYARSIVHN